MGSARGIAGGRSAWLGRFAWALAALLLMVVPAAGTATASDPASPNKRHRDRNWKFSFLRFDDWAPIPLEEPGNNPFQSAIQKAHVARFVQKDEYAKSGRFSAGSIELFRMGGPTAVVTGEKPPGGIRVIDNDAPKSMRELLAKIAERMGLAIDPKKAKEIKSKDGVPGQLWTIERARSGAYMLFAAWKKDDVEVGMIVSCDAELKKKYELGFKRIVNSFTWFDEKAEDVVSLTVLDGLRISAKKRRSIEKGMVAGWDVIVSSAKNYIVIYNRNGRRNDRLAKTLAERIEAIRAQIYEVQFPPAKPIEAVSIVRVCGDRDEYHHYGGPGGSAGYWSDQSEELVFYDAEPKDSAPDDDTLSVCYHEAFHQYIYYSVGSVAPHSWFNEGHGDYYAGSRFSGSRFTMKPFRWRIKWVKGAIKNGECPYEERTDEDGTRYKFDRSNGGYTPLKALVRLSQGEYYSYPAISYAQGWSLVWFLREEVPKNKEWNAKWGHILDTYFTTLKAEVNKETPLKPKSVDEGDDPGDVPGMGPTEPGMGEPGMGEAPAPGMGDAPPPGMAEPLPPTPGMGDAPLPGMGDTPAPAPPAPAPPVPAPPVPSPSVPAPPVPAPPAPPGMGDAPPSPPGMDDAPPPGMGDSPPPGMGDAPPPGMGDEPPGDDEPPEARIAIGIFGRESSKKALKKAIEAAFKDVDFDELEAAWKKEILKIPDPPKRK